MIFLRIFSFKMSFLFERTHTAPLVTFSSAFGLLSAYAMISEKYRFCSSLNSAKASSNVRSTERKLTRSSSCPSLPCGASPCADAAFASCPGAAYCSCAGGCTPVLRNRMCSARARRTAPGRAAVHTPVLRTRMCSARVPAALRRFAPPTAMLPCFSPLRHRYSRKARSVRELFSLPASAC